MKKEVKEKEIKKTKVKENKNNNTKKITINILFLLIGVLIGSVVMFLINPSKNITNEVVKTSSNSKFDVLYETYETIKEKYYKEISDETLINGAIDGMMNSLDDEHSVFFDENSKKTFEDELSGTYYGIGAEIKQISNDEVMINKVFDGSPAEKAGLKSGDIFVSIDGESTKGKKVNEIAENLRSESKDTASIVIKRNDKELTIKVQKDNVNLLSVSSEMLNDNIGYISISIFGEKTYSQFVSALNNLEEENMKSLIIDVRGNSGGYLSTVTKMISEFVNKDTVIYQMKTNEGIKKYNAINDKTKDYKVVILVDENSASASEIMASALKEQYGATLVGVTTYGKGTVQETKNLSNNTLIKYTIEEWLTSNGESINGVGVKPDVEIKLSEEYTNNPTRENDNQLQKGIELAK